MSASGVVDELPAHHGQMSSPQGLDMPTPTHHSGLSTRMCVRRLSRRAVDLNVDGLQVLVTGMLLVLCQERRCCSF